VRGAVEFQADQRAAGPVVSSNSIATDFVGAQSVVRVAFGRFLIVRSFSGRPDCAKGPDEIIGPEFGSAGDGEVVCRERPGGLLRYYYYYRDAE